jgi:uncharacterized protein YjbI with pentapeptide repeats
MDIKNIHDAVIFTSAAVTLRDAVLDAIKQKVNLGYANLGYANLRHADLSYANLRHADLGYADLGYANLRYADLRYADLRYADLRHADLGYANLRHADLGYANLRGADLRYADLGYANLGSANLGSADLGSANLRYANLRSADLRYANLRSANLRGANLGSADLRYADLRYAKNITDKLAIAQFQFIPTDGPFIGWKKCKNEVIVKLCISKSAQRSHGTERKCRASQVKVLEVFGASEGISSYDPSVIYRKGKIVKCVEPFDENRWENCASGIHFYLTREEAEAH